MKIRATVAAIAVFGFAAMTPAAKADEVPVGGYVVSSGSTDTSGTDSYGKADSPDSYGKADSTDSYGKA